MDLDVPIMDGMETTAEIRSRGHGISIIAVTGNVRKE
jgi:CheY-like chemotaxis protein